MYLDDALDKLIKAVKDDFTSLEIKVGSLNNLQTTDKVSVISAINELENNIHKSNAALLLRLQTIENRLHILETT